MEEEEKFESRILVDSLDILAVVNHLQDNLGKRPRVILTINPRVIHESDYCSIKETEEKTVQIKNEKEISDINKFLNQNLFMANIHVAIE